MLTEVRCIDQSQDCLRLYKPRGQQSRKPDKSIPRAGSHPDSVQRQKQFNGSAVESFIECEKEELPSPDRFSRDLLHVMKGVAVWAERQQVLRDIATRFGHILDMVDFECDDRRWCLRQLELRGNSATLSGTRYDLLTPLPLPESAAANGRPRPEFAGSARSSRSCNDTA